MPRLLRVKAVKPTVINLGDDAQADLLLLHKIAELVTINQIDSRRHNCGGVAGAAENRAKVTSTARSAPAAPASRWNNATTSRPIVSVGA